MLKRTSILFLCALMLALMPVKQAEAQAFSVTKLSDVDLLTAYAPATFSGSYYNIIGTNSSVSYAAGYSGPATATVGSLRINGPVGTTVQVSCDTTGSARNSVGCCGNLNRAIDQTRFVIGTANAVGPGSGNVCAGVGSSVVNHTITGNAAQDTILLGGRFNVTNVRIGGQYSTVGRTPITVRVRRVSPSSTIDTDVHWYAIFESSIAFSATQNMLFGTIDYTTINAADRANLATNGAMTYAGGFTGPATGTAGFATVTGVEPSVVLEVYCDTTATMTRTGGGSIQVTNLEVDPEDGLGAIGTGSACNGVAGAAAFTFTYATTTRDTVYIGGRVNGSTASGFGSGGSFSTANAGGDNVELIILNQ